MERQTKKVWLTGASGQLGQALLYLYPTLEELGAEWMTGLNPSAGGASAGGAASVRLDISKDGELRTFLQQMQPDVIINAAAFTQVDRAGLELLKSYRTNAEAVRTMARYCAERGCMLLQVSTDYLFGGADEAPYHEEATPYPINIYGATKALGEVYIKEELSEYYILRTAWLYGPSAFGSNFYTAIRSQALQGKRLRVVEDEVGSPTSTLTFARLVFAFLKAYLTSSSPLPYGIYHATDEGSTSRYEWAKAIIALDPATADIAVTPIRSSELPPRPATRPHDTTLCNDKIKPHLPHLIRPWREALEEVYHLDQR